MQTPLIRTLAALAALSMLAVPAHAGSDASPEISDRAGDINPVAFLTTAPQDLALPAEVDALDLVKAYVTGENRDWFYLRLQVEDLPSAWALPPLAADELPYGPQIQYLGMNLTANFTVGSKAYSAVAWLSNPIAPTVGGSDVPALPVLQDSYWLVGPNGARTQITGDLNLGKDYVQMRILKSQVGNPVDGAQLTKFWTHSDFAGKFKVDFAPDARAFDPLIDHRPPINTGDLTGTQVVVSQYGRDFTFGSYVPPSIGIQLAAASAQSHEFQPGQSFTYAFQVKNTGALADAGRVSLSPAAAGWSRQLDDDAFDLAPGASKTFHVTAMALRGAADHDTISVTVDSDRGGHGALGFESSLSAFIPGGSVGGGPVDTSALSSQSAGDSGKGPAPKSKKSPGPEAVVLVASVAVLVVLLRRRTA